MTLSVGRRFMGPPGSANGGYLAGLFAGRLPEAPAVTVALRRSPPLEVPMQVRRDGAVLRLTYGEELIAEAAAAEVAPEPLEPVPFAEAEAATARYGGLVEHPFPHCFVCGPERAPGDGLRLRPGRVEGRAEVVATPWVPDASFAAGDDGLLPAELVWAALDCPGGWSVDLAGRPMVLGRMTGRVAALPRAGDRCFVVGHALGGEGRKAFTVSTLFGGAGEVLGTATATWIEVNPATAGRR